jgi:hypothetical protein
MRKRVGFDTIQGSCEPKKRKCIASRAWFILAGTRAVSFAWQETAPKMAVWSPKLVETRLALPKTTVGVTRIPLVIDNHFLLTKIGPKIGQRLQTGRESSSHQHRQAMRKMADGQWLAYGHGADIVLP